MNLLQSIFGRKPVTPQPPPPSAFPVEVVGESSYQENFIRIFGRPKGDGINTVVAASVTLEDDNPYDDQAVRIAIKGMTVGYLSRAQARKYRKVISVATNEVQANVRGGWNRAGDTGQYGIWLQIPEMEKRKAPVR